MIWCDKEVNRSNYRAPLVELWFLFKHWVLKCISKAREIQYLQQRILPRRREQHWRREWRKKGHFGSQNRQAIWNLAFWQDFGIVSLVSLQGSFSPYILLERMWFVGWINDSLLPFQIVCWIWEIRVVRVSLWISDLMWLNAAYR